MADKLLAILRPQATDRLGDQSDTTSWSQLVGPLVTPPDAFGETTSVPGSGPVNNLDNSQVAISYLIFHFRVKVQELNGPWTPQTSILSWNTLAGSGFQVPQEGYFLHDNVIHEYTTAHITTRPGGGPWVFGAVNQLFNLAVYHATFDDAAPLGPGFWQLNFYEAWAEVWGVDNRVLQPPTNIVYNPTRLELLDSVRRLINDIDTSQLGIPEPMLSEMLIAEYMAMLHSLGADPRTPASSQTGVDMLAYTITAGNWQAQTVIESDISAIDAVYTNQRTEPLTFLPVAELEARVASDLARIGRVAASGPIYWTVRFEQLNANAMSSRIEVYPACDVDTVVYWPRSIEDPVVVDPGAVAWMPLSFNLRSALKYKLAAQALRSMPDWAIARNGISRDAAASFDDQAYVALEAEMRMRGLSFRSESIGETVQ